MEEGSRGQANLPEVLFLKASYLKESEDAIYGRYINHGLSLGNYEENVAQDVTSISDDSTIPVERQPRWGFVLILVGLSTVQFSTFVSMFILASFFLHVCEERNVTGIQGGAIIGMVQCVLLVMSYIFLGLSHRISLKTQMVVSLSVAGVTLVIFAFLDRIENQVTFIALCLLVRAFQGTAIAISDVCALIVANKASPPEKRGTVIGYMELFVALGQAIAPALGGHLFEIGKYYSPFLVSAGMLFLSAAICMPTIPKNIEVERKYVSEMVKDTFKMLPYFIQFVIFGGFLGFFGGMIEPHLRDFHLSHVLIGMVIFVTTAFSGFTFPIWGYVCDVLFKPAYVTLFSCALGAVGFILFGPLPGVPIAKTLWLVIFSLAVCGTAISGAIISSYAQCRIRLGKVCRTEDNADTVISASYISSYNFGAFLGAVLGGVFIDYFGFSIGSAILLGIQIAAAVIQLYIMWQQKRGNA